MVVSLRFVLCALLGGSLVSHPLIVYAQASPVIPSSFVYGPTGGSLTSGTINSLGGAARTWASNMTSGAVTVADASVARIAANDVAMSSARSIPWAGIARGAARALPYVAVGSLLWTIYDTFRCRSGGASVSSLLCDAGVPPVEGVEYNANGAGWSSSRDTTCQLALAAGFPSGGHTASVVLQDGTLLCRVINTANGAVAIQYGFAQRSGLACTGGGVIGADGKCPSGVLVSVPFDEAAEKLLPFNPLLVPNPADVAKVVAEKGIDLAPYAAPGVLTGPSAVTGPLGITTVTPPGGPPATTTTYPVYNIVYNNNSYSFVTTTTTTAPDGTTSTSSTPTDVPLCGLPGKPVCNVKVDETGTESVARMAESEAALAAKQVEITGKIAETVGTGAKTSLPTNWGWVVPIGSCSAFRFDTTRLGTFAVDPCSSSGVALWRSLLAWYLGAMTLLYVWRSGTELKGG